MHANLLLALTAGLLAGPAPQAKDTIEGTWVVVSAVADGKPHDEIKGDKLTFTRDGKVTIKTKNKDEKGTYRVDPGKKPSAIDLTEEGKTDAIRGVYALDGDTLKVCVGDKPGAPRPTELSAEKGSGRMLIELKREKK